MNKDRLDHENYLPEKNTKSKQPQIKVGVQQFSITFSPVHQNIALYF
jgi:hypothetical protein